MQFLPSRVLGTSLRRLARRASAAGDLEKNEGLAALVTVGTARPLRSLAICQISHLYHKISVCKEPVKPSGQNCRKFFALCPISGASAVIWENIVDWAWGRKTAAQHGSEYVRDIARIPGPAGVAGGKRRGRTKSGKGGRGFISRQASSPRLMQIGYSVQRGARRASSSLVPRLAPRGFPGRQGWRGGERQGWRVSAVRKGGGCAGCEKGHGRGRVTFPPLGSVLTSHRSDSRSGTKWWGAASLPGPDVLLSPASRRSDSRSGRNGGRGGFSPAGAPCPGGARLWGAGCKKARAQGMGGGVRWRAHGVSGREKTAVCAGERTGRRGGHPPPTSIGLPVQRGEAGRGKGEVRADPAECNSPRTVRAGRFALDPGGYLSSRAVSSQVLSAYEGLTAVFGMGTGGTPQLNHRKLPVP